MNFLALCYADLGKYELALSLSEQILELSKSKLGPEHPDTINFMGNLALTYKAAGRVDRALPLFQDTLALRKAVEGPDHPHTLRCMNNLALAYQDAGQFDRALPLLVDLAELRKRKPGADSREYAGTLAALGLNHLQQEAWTEAETVLRELLTIYENKAPDAWQTFNVRAELGAALLGQKQYTAAEPLLRAGYEGMKLRAEKIPPQRKFRLAEALDRLIALAEATNKPDEARMWKDERAKLPAASAPKPEAEDP
jgi:tetratricopeptide (TPR) repeat protein